MKIKLFSALMVAALLLMLVSPSGVQAGAYEADYVTSITYQNVGTGTTTTLSLLFYETPTSTVPITRTLANLAAGASASVYVGSLLTSSFEGTAVMAADQPLAAVLVQVSTSGAVKVRPLSNGFTGGTPSTMVPTVFKQPHINTIFSVQNAGSGDTTATINFIPIDASNGNAHQIIQLLKPGAGIVVDAGTVSQIGTAFNGSVVVTSTGGSLVSSAMELGAGTDYKGRAFEGVGQGASTVYMPSAACNASNQNSYYAVQNTGGGPTNVTVTYSNGASSTRTNLAAGAKHSFVTCNVDSGTMPNGWGGSAVITSTAEPIVAIGKTSGLGWLTGYLGFTNGTPKLALPYVRWACTAAYNTGNFQQTYIAIQNLSGFQIPANEVRVRYIDQNGVLKGTHTISSAIPNNGKVNSLPTNAGLTEFGYGGPCPAYTSSGGGAIIEYTGALAGVKLVAIARVYTLTGAGGYAAVEDYNAIDWP